MVMSADSGRYGMNRSEQAAAVGISAVHSCFGSIAADYRPAQGAGGGAPGAGARARSAPSVCVSAVIPARPPSCIVSTAVLGTMTMVALSRFSPS